MNDGSFFQDDTFSCEVMTEDSLVVVGLSTLGRLRVFLPQLVIPVGKVTARASTATRLLINGAQHTLPLWVICHLCLKVACKSQQLSIIFFISFFSDFLQNLDAKIALQISGRVPKETAENEESK